MLLRSAGKLVPSSEKGGSKTKIERKSIKYKQQYLFVSLEKLKMANNKQQFNERLFFQILYILDIQTTEKNKRTKIVES